jgi:YesN/AraC family two-component response regulator
LAASEDEAWQEDGRDAGHDPLPAERQEDERKRILIVDDNVELRRLLRSYLDAEFSIAEAEHGAAALEQVRTSLPDLILSDLMMPVMDGHQLCQALRADPETDFIPLLILTAKAGLEHRIDGLDRGADAYLAKPFDRRELLATVHALLRTQLRLRDHYLAQSSRAGDAPGIHPEAGLPEPSDDTVSTLPGRKEQLRVRFDALIEQHLADEDFRIEQLADGMAQSRSTLNRWCKEHLGQSPGDAIRNARLARARALLQRGEGSVTEVAYAVGYRSIAHFSTAFRQATGVSPSAFRQEHALKQGPEAS